MPRPTTNYWHGDPLALPADWHLLADDTWVEDRFRLERRLISPVKHPHNPVLLPDRPWEGGAVGPASVFWDGDFGKYRMWYRCADLDNYYGGGGPPYYLAYAESDDGLTWEKPMVGTVDLPGQAQTNVVYAGTHYPRFQGPQVWKDETATDAARRYKMLGVERRPDDGGVLRSGVQLAYSGDGFHWALDDTEGPLLGFHSDCFNHLVRDPTDSFWLLYCRPIPVHAASPGKGRRPDLPAEMTGPRRHGGRRVAVASSPDLKTWSRPRTVLYPDERDAPDIDQCRVFREGSSLLMLYAAMDGDDTGRNELHLATSGDGFHWQRLHDREPFLRPGASGAWDGGTVSSGDEPVTVGNERFLYYVGGNLGQHEEGHLLGGIGLARMSARRFVEQRAGTRPGYLLTREFVLQGDRLRVDTTGAPGPGRQPELRVEILEHPPVEAAWEVESDGSTVFDGFSLADCDPITADRREVTVTWRGESDLSSLRGKSVYLRFYLRDKGLCAFQIDSKP